MTDNWLTARREKLLLAVIFLIVASSTTIWTIRDKTPPPWDPSDHMRYAYDYYHLVAALDFKGFAREFFVAPHFYAPLVHLSTAAIFLLFGASRLTGILINFIALAILLVSVSWIAIQAAGAADQSRVDRIPAAKSDSVLLIGVLAAMIAACSHFSAWLIHDAFLDFPLTAAVACGMALLIRAGDFSSRRAALQFAVAAGLGLLVKQTYAFFFILPALVVTVRVLLSKRRDQILNLVLVGLVITAIASIWYGPHFIDVVSIYRENQRAAFDENEAPLFSFDSNFFPIHALLSFQLQVPFAVLFLVGLGYSLARRRGDSAILYLWLASGLGAFALVANKDVRYTVPVVPAAAVLCVCWLRALFSSSNERVRRAGLAISVAIASWCLVSVVNAQWPAPGMGIYINTPRYQWMVFARNYFSFDHRPLNDDWSVPEIVKTVAELGLDDESAPHPLNTQPTGDQFRITSPKQGASPAQSDEAGGGRQPTLGVVVNLPHLNPSAVALYARLLAKRGSDPLIRVQWLVVDGSLEQIGECQYILARTGLESADWVASIEREFEQMARSHPERFQRVASFPIPLKNAEAVIYRVLPERRTSNTIADEADSKGPQVKCCL